MSAHLERANGYILRLSSNPDWKYGDAYDCAVYVVPTDGGKTAVLKAHQGAMPTMENRREIAECLAAAGFERAGWERYEDGEVRAVIYPIEPHLRRA